MIRLSLALAPIAALMSMLLLTGCLAKKTESTDLASFSFAQSNLLIHSIADSCVSVIDTDTKKAIGNIRNEYFRPAFDFDVTDKGDLYLPLNGDFDTTEKEVVLVSLTDGVQTTVPVNYAPERVFLGDGEYSLLSHNAILEHAPGEFFDMTVMSNDGTSQLYSTELPGIVKDAVLAKNVAYIALQDFKNRTNHALLEFDLKERKVQRTFPLPAKPKSLIRSVHNPDVFYVSLSRFNPNGGCTNAPPAEIMEISINMDQSRTVAKLHWPGKLLEQKQDHLLVTEECAGAGTRLRQIDIHTGQTVREREVGKNPFDLITLPDDTVAVTIASESKVIFLDSETLEIEREVELVCKRPQGMKLYRP